MHSGNCFAKSANSSAIISFGVKAVQIFVKLIRFLVEKIVFFRM